jgi:hypothetical protein
MDISTGITLEALNNYELVTENYPMGCGFSNAASDVRP